MERNIYKYLFYLFLAFSFASCIFILVQRQLYKEKLECLGYSFTIKEGESKVKSGMTREEVIKLIGHQPDQIDEQDNEIILRWSAIFHQGKLTNVIDRYDGMGYYWVIIVFDKQNKVIRNSSGPA
jgi:hypothetical protein